MSAEALARLAVGVLVLASWVVAATMVARDMHRRGLRGWPYGVLVFLLWPVGVPLWLFVRSRHPLP